MKKSATIKRKTIKLVVKNLIVFAVLIAVASVGVRSWLNDQEASKVEAKGMTNINFSAPEGMQIAVVAPGEDITSDTIWHEETFSLDNTIVVDGETVAEFPFMETVKLSEISSDGRTFIKPPIMQHGSVAYVDNRTDTDWSDSVIGTTPNVDYLSFDVYFRTRSSGYKVQLDSTTYCGTDSATPNWGNSVSGWSPDTVIGAARVSVIDPTVTAANAARNTWQKLLWIPAPFLHYDPVTYSNDDQLKTEVTNTTNQYGLVWKDGNTYRELHNNGTRGDGTYNHGYWLNKTTRSRLDYSSGVANATSAVTANTSLDTGDIFTLPGDVNVATLSNQTTYNSVQYYTNHVRVNIWIEGEDPESRSTQLGGQIRASFKFKLVTA